MRFLVVTHSIVLALLLLAVQRPVVAKGLLSQLTRSKLPSKGPQNNEPYDTVAQFLSRFGKGTDLESYEHEEIRRAIKALSKGQSALKSMDGATHQLRNVFKEISSLGSRHEKFLKSKRKKLKEAAKIYEYTRSVERGLQATEILQASSTKDNSRRTTYLAEAGLKELKRVEIQVDKLKCVVSVLTPIETADTASTHQEPVSSVRSTNSSTASNQSTATTTRPLTKAERAQERKLKSTPQRFFPGEIIISITELSRKESTVLSQILRVVTREKPGRVALKTTDDGAMDQDDQNNDNGGSAFMSVQPTYLALACKALQAVEEYIVLPEPNVDAGQQPQAAACAQSAHSDATTTASSNKRSNNAFEANAKKDSVYMGSRRPAVTTPTATTSSATTTSQSSSDASGSVRAEASEPQLPNPPANLRNLPSRIRIVGHSAGGAVGAVLAMILDGGVLTSTQAGGGSDTGMHRGSSRRGIPDNSGMDKDSVDLQRASSNATRTGNDNKSRNSIVADTTDCAVLLKYASPYTGLYANRVNCITLGAPPCLSRTTVPRYITSFVCGDDLIPRAQAGALRDLRGRTVKALKSGAGKKGGLAYAMSAGLLGDLSSIAGKSLRHYKGKPSRDVQQLSIPGRVLFVKPRQLKEGATIQRVLRGNWQEDMLWQLHNILLSKRMLEHHSLDSYIRTLNRC